MQERKTRRINSRVNNNSAGRSSKGQSSVLAAVCLCLVLSGGSCQKKVDMDTLENLVQMHNPTYKGEPVSREAVQEVNKALSEYREAIEEQVERREELGILYRDLALRYLDISAIKTRIAEIRLADEEESFSAFRDDSLYYEALALGYLEKDIFSGALESLEKAISIFPLNKLLYYNAGVCAANIGKSMVGEEQADERERWLQDAAAYYRRALELDENYADALYGMAVLLVYELDRPYEAEELLVRLMDLQPKNTEGRFLLGAVYYMTGRYEQAIEQYELIEASGASRDNKRQARKNRETIMEEVYETRKAE